MTNGSNYTVNEEFAVLTLADIFEALTCTRPAGKDVPFPQVTADSLRTTPGALFVALPGQHTDGHLHVGDAFHRGARTALVHRDLSQLFPVIDLRSGALPHPLVIPDVPFCLRVTDTQQALGQITLLWRAKQPLRTTAVIASVQPTLTQELVAEVLAQRYRTLCIHSGDLPEVNLPLTLLQMSGKYSRAILDINPSHPLASPDTVDYVQPAIAAILNAGPQHNSQAGHPTNIARSVITLLQSLPSAPQGVALLNADDPASEQLAGYTRARVITYGTTPSADLWAGEIESQGAEGIRFCVHLGRESLYLRVPLLGRCSVHIALLAAAVGLCDGLSWQDIARGLQMGKAGLRLVTADSPSGAILLDDSYSSSPESTLAALTFLNTLGGRKVAVLGQDLANEANPARMVGVRAAEVVQELVAVGEQAEPIAKAAKQAGLSAQSITWAKTTEDALVHLRRRLSSGDVVLIKGTRAALMDGLMTALTVSS